MSRSRIRNIPSLIPQGEQFLIICKTSRVTAAVQKKYAIAELQLGNAIIPNGVGSVSKFNANGKFILRKDLPKEQRYIRTIYWEWEQWAQGGGTETVSDFRDIYRECYQREEISPPACMIGRSTVEGHDCFVSQKISTTTSSEKDILHYINLFLEIFGEYEISSSERVIRNTKVELVSWHLLPPGEQPFEKLSAHIKKVIGKAPRTLPVIEDRQIFLNKLGPEKIFVGLGGFSTYVAYQFKGLTVLESIKIDNAIYVFRENWRTVSRLTKKEIIEGELAEARIIHTNGWKDRILEIIGT